MYATTKRRQNRASVRYTLEVEPYRRPRQCQPYGRLESGYWSISLDGLVALAARDLQIWMLPTRRGSGCPPHVIVGTRE